MSKHHKPGSPPQEYSRDELLKIYHHLQQSDTLIIKESVRSIIKVGKVRPTKRPTRIRPTRPTDQPYTPKFSNSTNPHSSSISLALRSTNPSQQSKPYSGPGRRPKDHLTSSRDAWIPEEIRDKNDEELQAIEEDINDNLEKHLAMHADEENSFEEEEEELDIGAGAEFERLRRKNMGFIVDDEEEFSPPPEYTEPAHLSQDPSHHIPSPQSLEDLEHHTHSPQDSYPQSIPQHPQGGQLAETSLPTGGSEVSHLDDPQIGHIQSFQPEAFHPPQGYGFHSSQPHVETAPPHHDSIGSSGRESQPYFPSEPSLEHPPMMGPTPLDGDDIEGEVSQRLSMHEQAERQQQQMRLHEQQGPMDERGGYYVGSQPIPPTREHPMIHQRQPQASPPPPQPQYHSASAQFRPSIPGGSAFEALEGLRHEISSTKDMFDRCVHQLEVTSKQKEELEMFIAMQRKSNPDKDLTPFLAQCANLDVKKKEAHDSAMILKKKGNALVEEERAFVEYYKRYETPAPEAYYPQAHSRAAPIPRYARPEHIHQEYVHSAPMYPPPHSGYGHPQDYGYYPAPHDAHFYPSAPGYPMPPQYAPQPQYDHRYAPAPEYHPHYPPMPRHDMIHSMDMYHGQYDPGMVMDQPAPHSQQHHRRAVPQYEAMRKRKE
ncbi:hypothetical protein ADUPG1_009819 [Aduncisulcus paluster]|uniref:Uncharacterized protein n=1 Tax=Aduncisulcus paluster TaxID=2918883 RepID=A0ABQ5KWW2_9EUKA|nr:hypothetical protein ADUPG1_009819 [Aduncisulcus paluster]|eukprot:gnl/Carplike_NY0171/2680_a3601_426.p1 GENE.gnl/Carplike_NY0171/2680_a3601_426~~gnl/Carplike_NY0171/2680_a3601_426.p1  ORF type:complete len:656 (+),score=182.22 gnl/Carplike_NY0171/2680_a3601_426:30-1997(+)